jgi:hypothetical protein
MTGILFMVIGALVLLAVGKGLQHVKAKRSDEARTRELVKLAQVCYPTLSVTDSLDKLYEMTYKNLVRTQPSGGKVKKLMRDRILIADERMRIWREQAEQRLDRIEAESYFKVVLGKHITPRQPASAR